MSNPDSDAGILQLSRDDILISVLGVTGSGKSTFISKCCDNQTVNFGIGHSLESETKEVAAYIFNHRGTRITLVDTPGFDDTYRTDSEVLRDLAYWLTKTYGEHQIKLTGMIYLHRITDPRMTGHALKNLRTFKKLCGTSSLKSVVLATTRWDDMSHTEQDKRSAQIREDDLRDSPEFWGTMIQNGSTMVRHTNDRDSALNIIDLALAKANGGRTVLELQKEMVDQHRRLDETAAGQEVEGEILKQRKLFENRLKQAEADMREAIAERDDKYAQEIAQEQRKLQEMVAQSERGRASLRTDMERLIAEKDEQHRAELSRLKSQLAIEKQKYKAQQSSYASRSYSYPYPSYSRPSPSYSYGHSSRRGRQTYNEPAIALAGAGAAIGGAIGGAALLSVACSVM